MTKCAVNGCPYEVTPVGDGTWRHVGTHGALPGHAAVPKREPELHEYSRQFGEERSLEVRLVEYRDSLRGMVPQLELVAQLAEAAGRDAAPIRDGIRLHTIIADDLTKIIDGEELKTFVVTGEL